MQLLKKTEQVLFFLAIFFLPTQLGKHFWPDFALIYSLRIDYLSPTIYFWDILVVLLLFTAVLNRIIFNELLRSKVAINLLFLFLLTQVLSLVISPNIGAGFFRIEQYLIAGLFGVYVSSFKSKDSRVKLGLPLIMAVIFESILAICQVIKGGSLGFWILGERSFSITTPAIAKFDFYGVEILRPYATFSHPNVLAAFILIGLLLLQIYLHRFKVLMIGVNVLMAAVLVLSFSRATLLAFIFSVIFFLRKKTLVLILGLAILVSPLLFARFSSLLSYDNLTVLRRTELAEKSFEYFLRSPLFGVGLNNFIPTLSYDMVSGPNRFLQPVHNIFLLSLSETGIVGLIGFGTLIGYPLFKLKADRRWLVIWGVILFLGLFDHFFLTIPQGYRLLFLIWGLSLSRINSIS